MWRATTQCATACFITALWLDAQLLILTPCNYSRGMPPRLTTSPQLFSSLCRQAAASSSGTLLQGGGLQSLLYFGGAGDGVEVLKPLLTQRGYVDQDAGQALGAAHGQRTQAVRL